MPPRQDALALLDRYVRIPTISRQVTPAMVDDIRAFWRDAGLALEPLHPESGPATPALYGEIPGPPGARTLLLYGHYDVQPTGDLARWRWEDVACQPFSPTYFGDARVVDPRTLDDEALANVVMVARGGADNKGQHLANILGALDAARAGTLAWTVKILLDGEEEHGSPNLAAIARAHRDRLAADVLIASDGPMQKNRPTMVMGVRGLLGVELTAENGQRASVHSGNYGNIVPNPVLPLARLIDDIETRVHAYAAGQVAFQREATEAFAKWEDKAVWKPYLRPTVNVNHFMSDGASPELRRTIIPRSAGARLDIRLTPDTAPEPIEAIVRAAVDDHQGRTAGIRFTAKLAGQPASYTSAACPEFGWLLRLLEEVHDTEPVALPTLGGTLPAWVFTEVLRIPSFWIPSANSDNQQHDVNEHYVLGCFFRQIEVYRTIASSRPV
ncbi:MAG: M20/M25/M40 family metallo-hydrolase [Candidatus Rokubacteria bacterium]|nr:M20/M25/M40 family metallo-hydrolase [Candidatus Rokubacteria bacterium]